jgi:hypothetical protein
VNTYFITIHVSPEADNPLITKIEEAHVHFWIVDASGENAMDRATRYLASYKWKMESVDAGPVETTAADFATQEEGMKGFWKARQKGFAAQFVGKPRQGQMEPKKSEP